MTVGSFVLNLFTSFQTVGAQNERKFLYRGFDAGVTGGVTGGTPGVIGGITGGTTGDIPGVVAVSNINSVS